MAIDVIVVGTVAATGTALIGYRLLRNWKPIRGAWSTRITALTMVDVKTVMMVLISLLVLGSSLYIILSGQYDSENQKWAFGVVGSIMGFWLRPEKT